jgi:hypothetical protein
MGPFPELIFTGHLERVPVEFIHAYDTFQFTHQGLIWELRPDNSLSFHLKSGKETQRVFLSRSHGSSVDV